jgi:hypothetical protein
MLAAPAEGAGGLSLALLFGPHRIRVQERHHGPQLGANFLDRLILLTAGGLVEPQPPVLILGNPS